MMQKELDGGWFDKKPLSKYPMRINKYTNSKVTDYNVAEMGLEDMKIKNMDTTLYQSHK